MTFSIAARCADTGMLGVSVCSSSPAVAARCTYARAGVGAGTLATDGQPATVTYPPVTANITQADNVLINGTTQLTLDNIVLVEQSGQTHQLVLAKILSFNMGINAGAMAKVSRRFRSNAVKVGQ